MLVLSSLFFFLSTAFFSFLGTLHHSLLRVVLLVFFDPCIDDHGSLATELSRVEPYSTNANIANCYATSSTTEQRVFWPWPLWQFFFAGASSGAHTDSRQSGLHRAAACAASPSK